MFERFTNDARQVVVFAQEESKALGHDHIGSEHLLLGVLRDGDADAAAALESLNVTLESVRDHLVRVAGRGEPRSWGQIPFTANGKRALESALQEALFLGDRHITPEHILLGLQGQPDSLAARILHELGADPQAVRLAVMGRLTIPGRRLGGLTGVVEEASAGQLPNPAWFDELGRVLNAVGALIAQRLARPPDSGDLLLVLASIPHTLLAHVLSQLNVDPNRLQDVIERSRNDLAPEREEAAKLYQVRRAKEQAIESQDFPRAARLRDQERQLVAEGRALQTVPAELVRLILSRLGIPDEHSEN